jgi:hypothetical protein
LAAWKIRLLRQSATLQAGGRQWQTFTGMSVNAS